MIHAVRGFLDRIPDPPDTNGATLPGWPVTGFAAFSLKMPSLPQFDRQVRRGKDPVQPCSLCLWNSLQAPVGTYAFPDREILCRANAGEMGKEDRGVLVRARPQPFRPRSKGPAHTPHGNE